MIHINLMQRSYRAMRDIAVYDALDRLEYHPSEFFSERKNPEMPNLKQTIALFYAGGFIDNETLDRTLEKAIIKQGVANYNALVRKRFTPESLAFMGISYGPETLAYALEKKVLTGEDAQKLQLNRGSTPEAFVRHQRPRNLIEKIKKDLFGIAGNHPYVRFLVERSDKARNKPVQEQLTLNDRILLDELEADDFTRRENQY